MNHEEIIKKIKSWDSGVLRAMLFSIKDEQILNDLVIIGEEYEKARCVANKV